MARPQLANLAPTITRPHDADIGSTIGAFGDLGNPELSPFRAENYDLSARVVFRGRRPAVGRGVQEGRDQLPADRFDVPATLQERPAAGTVRGHALQTLTPQQIAWVLRRQWRRARPLCVRQFHDSPGGEIEGYEISYQQDFTFLPGFWKNFGVQANYTHLTSELQYIVDPGNTLVTPTTPVRPQITRRARSPVRRRSRRTSRCTTRRRSGARALPRPTVRRT